MRGRRDNGETENDRRSNRPGVGAAAIGVAVLIGSLVGGGATWASGAGHAQHVVIVPGKAGTNTVSINPKGNTVGISTKHNTVGISTTHNTVRLDSSHSTVTLNPNSTVTLNPSSTVHTAYGSVPLTGGSDGTTGAEEVTLPAHTNSELDFYDTTGDSSVRVIVNAPQNGPGTPCNLTASVTGSTGQPGPGGDGIEGTLDSFAVTYAVGVSKQYQDPPPQIDVIADNNAATSCVVGWVVYGERS